MIDKVMYIKAFTVPLFCLWLFFSVTAGLAQDETPTAVFSEEFEIKKLKKRNCPGYIYSGDSWEYGIESIQVELEYAGTKSSARAKIRAYFYDRDNKLIETYDAPPRRQDEDKKYIEAPTEFVAGEEYIVYFPIAKFLRDGDCETIIVTFGNNEEVAVNSNKRIKDKKLYALDFAERSIIFPDAAPLEASPSADDKSSEASAFSNLRLKIKDIEEIEHPQSMMFNGDWAYGKPAIRTQVSVKGDFLPEPSEVSAYFYGADHKLIVKREPTMTRIGGGYYVKNPKIAKAREWYLVFFALNGKLTDSEWETVVIEFKFQDNTLHEIETDAGATLGSLGF